MVYIAETMFDVVLNPKSRWGFLEDELTSLMETVQECHCIACNGGPCNPLTHLFQPSEYLPPTAGGDDIDILLQENQIDLHPTPEASPSLQQADGQASREALQREALAQMQQHLPRIDETEEISVASPADEPEVRRSGSSGNAITKGVRSLLNQLTASSSKATSPRPTDTPLPVQSGKHGGRVLRPRLVTGVTPQPRFPTPQPRLPTPHIGLSGHSTTNRVWSGQGGAQQVPPTDSLAATMAQLTRLMEIQNAAAAREREEERALRRENNTTLATVLEKFMEKPGGTEAATSSKGRVSMVPHSNPAALALTGCAVAPKFAVMGDPSSVDLKDARHKIKSGRNVGVTLDARIGETWPNEYLCPLMMDGIDPKQFDHDRITLIQWAGGFVGKIFAEFNEQFNGSKEHNQLFILMKMLRLAENEPWSEIMKLNQALFSALERGVLTWTSREELENWWKLAMETLNNRTRRPAAAKRPLPATTPGQPPAKRVDNRDTTAPKKKDMFGIPGDFLRQKNICIRWNVSHCSESGESHVSPDRSATAPVRHICGGCAFLGKPDDSSHPMKSCRNKNTDGIFR